MRAQRFAGVTGLCLLALGVAGCVTSSVRVTPPPEIIVPGEQVFPESLTSTANGTVLIGSVGARSIFRAEPGSSNAQVWIPPGVNGLQGVFGVLADEKSKTLWACSGAFGPPPAGLPARPSTLLAFDLDTGAPKGRWPLPTVGGFCNDIAIGLDGAVYATDSLNMEVVRLAPGAEALEVWAGDGALGPRGEVLDGIAIVQDKVIVNTLVTGKLFSIPIGPDGKAGPVTQVTLDRPLERPDGQRAFGKNSLLVVESGGGGRLSRVTFSGPDFGTGQVTTIKEGFPDGPVSVTVIGQTAYVLEGQLATAMRGLRRDMPSKPFKATAVPVGRP